MPQKLCSKTRLPFLATALVAMGLVAVIWIWGGVALFEAVIQKSETGFEKRVQAAFPFRKAAMQVWNSCRWYVFAATPPTVVQGRDGWWFYRSEKAGDGESLNEAEGQVPADPALESAIVQVLAKRAQDAAQRNALYLLVIPPDKHRVMVEQLPPSFVTQTQAGRFERILTLAGPQAPILDLGPVLIAANQQESTYPHSDSHWIDAGAYAAYLAIMKELNRRRSGAFTPIERTAFQSLPYAWQGDLYNLSFLNKTEPVALWQAISPLPAHWSDGTAICQPGIFHGPKAYSAWKETEKGWKEAITLVENPNLPTAVIFHDSFMPALLPYLAQHFRRARFVWSCYQPSIVAEEQADFVLQESVQRNVRYLGECGK